MFPGAEPSLIVLVAALALDRLLSEFPNAVHPVAWMGHVISAIERIAPQTGRWRQLIFGALIATLVPTAFAAVSVFAVTNLQQWPILWFLVSVFLLKSAFAIRGLGRAAFTVRDAVARGCLAEARLALRGLCGRDASLLDEPLIVAATVESLAENSSDSFVAPLLYYLVFGLPGAVLYRAANTLDSMIGYHGRYEYLGKASARLDDVLNLVPARITAGLMLLAGWLCRADVRSGWTMFRRDGSSTESPNAGQPMAAMAGLLRIQLEKVGHYRLGNPTEPLAVGKIDDAWRIVTFGSGIAAGLGLAVLWIRHACVS